MKARLSGRAERELKRIDAYWRENRPEAPDLFKDELLKALRILCSAPHSGLPHGSFRSRLVRRVPLEKTHHLVYYVVEADSVFVLSIWGAPKQRPPRFGK